jgi:hypothetical protein
MWCNFLLIYVLFLERRATDTWLVHFLVQVTRSLCVLIECAIIFAYSRIKVSFLAFINPICANIKSLEWTLYYHASCNKSFRTSCMHWTWNDWDDFNNSVAFCAHSVFKLHYIELFLTFNAQWRFSPKVAIFSKNVKIWFANEYSNAVSAKNLFFCTFYGKLMSWNIKRFYCPLFESWRCEI